MVSDHAMADAERPVGVLPGGFGARQDQRAQCVGVVVVMLALKDGGEAFQSQTGIYRRPRQGDARTWWALLVLHEHKVPNLNEPVAILVRRAGWATGNGRTMVVEDLRTRPAGSGIAHTPEIVRGCDPDDALLRQSGDLAPDLRRGVVLGVHRDRQPVLRQAELLGHQLPRVWDRLLLEVVTEAEVPQHLEESVVPRGIADVVQVVVLAAGADAFLCRGGPHIGAFLLPGEHVLELHHARVDEHQRRVVARHQRRAFHHRVPIASEVVEEGGADVVAAGHGGGLCSRKGEETGSSAGVLFLSPRRAVRRPGESICLPHS